MKIKIPQLEEACSEALHDLLNDQTKLVATKLDDFIKCPLLPFPFLTFLLVFQSKTYNKNIAKGMASALNQIEDP